MVQELCNYQTTYGSAPKDCGTLQQWLNTLTGLLPTVDQTRCSSGAADPTSADLDALWSPCTPPEGAMVVWNNTTTSEYQIWYYCGGSWSEAGTDLCPTMDLRVVPTGTSTSNFNSYWTASGCSGPPDTGALVIENGTGNMWYWDSGSSSWNAISVGGGVSGSSRYRFTANFNTTSTNYYYPNLRWYDNGDNSLGTFSDPGYVYTVQKTGWVWIHMWYTRNANHQGDYRGTLRLNINSGGYSNALHWYSTSNPKQSGSSYQEYGGDTGAWSYFVSANAGDTIEIQLRFYRGNNPSDYSSRLYGFVLE